MKSLRRFRERLLILALCAVAVRAQPGSEEALLRRVADNVRREVRFGVVTTDTKQSVSTLTAPAPRADLSVASAFAAWSYTTALAIDGLDRLGARIEEPGYRTVGGEAFRWYFSVKDFAAQVRSGRGRIRGLEQFDQLRGLWGTGDMASVLVDAYRADPRPEYREYLERIVGYMIDHPHRAPNGALTRPLIGEGGAVTVDDVYPPAVLLGRWGRHTGDARYFAAALDQTDAFFASLWEPQDRLLSQLAVPKSDYRSGTYWCRGHGWFAIAQADLLENLPEDHPRRTKLLEQYRQVIYGVVRWQSKSGLWRHVLNREESELEVSGSAMIVYAVAKGVNHGWLDSIFRDAAMAGWAGIKTHIDNEGNFDGVAQSVGISVTPTYLLRIPTEKNDPRGHGPILLAGQEMLALLKTYPKPRPGDWRD